MLLRTMLVLLLSFASSTASGQNKEEVLSAVVAVQAKARPDARSAQTLGERRQGSGALIREGLVLTIGYLVIEAEAIQVTGADGTTVPATLAGYDHATGFGVLKLQAPLAGKPLPLGDSAQAAERTPAIVASGSGIEEPKLVYVVSRREFSGSWEYLLDSAIFTSPPVRAWSGAPLIGPRAELLGIGSLAVPDAESPGAHSPGNLFVPADLVKPILEDLIAEGRRRGPARPWLGVNTQPIMGRLFVSRVSAGGPAEAAGLRPGDIVLSLAGARVTTLADFYRKLWAHGPAGTEVPLRVLQDAEIRDLEVQSIDRLEHLRPSAR